MDTLASCLPLLTGQASPQVLQLDDVQALSGAEFLQMLTSLGTAAAPGGAGASTLPGLPTELNVLESKPPRDEPEVPAEAALALQWLPLTQFIESGMTPKSAGAAPAAAPNTAAAGLPAARVTPLATTPSAARKSSTRMMPVSTMPVMALRSTSRSAPCPRTPASSRRCPPAKVM